MDHITDINLTEIMDREGIACVKRYLVGRYYVELDNGNFGVADTVGNALEAAKDANADNIGRAA